MSCDVGEVPRTYVKPQKGCRMICDIGKAAEGLENQLPHSPTLTSLHLRQSSFSNPSPALPTSQLILQPFRCFTYVIGTSPTSELILQPFRRFIYATAHSTTLPPLHLRHRSLYNPSVASPTSLALHVLHLASRPCIGGMKKQSVVEQLVTASY